MVRCQDGCQRAPAIGADALSWARRYGEAGRTDGLRRSAVSTRGGAAEESGSTPSTDLTGARRLGKKCAGPVTRRPPEASGGRLHAQRMVGYPISGSFPVPCPNGGAGELVDNEGVVHYGEVCVQRGYHSHRFFYVSNLFAIGRTTGDTYGGRHILLSARNTHPGGPKDRNAKEIERIAWTATGSSGVTFWHFLRSTATSTRMARRSCPESISASGASSTDRSCKVRPARGGPLLTRDRVSGPPDCTRREDRR
jgi:hypothetical protein